MQRIGLIGGTGFDESIEDGSEEAVETKYGRAITTKSSLGSDTELIFVTRHGAGHKTAPHLINHRANIAALAQQQVSCVLATATVGSLQTAVEPGDFVILDDFIDLSRGGPITFYDEPGKVRHTDVIQPFDTRLQSVLRQTAGDQGDAAIHSLGVYVSVAGPRYETRSEIRLFAQWGATVVGMTVAPEAILCREAGLPYAAIAIVSNYGCGLLTDQPLAHKDVENIAAKRRDQITTWLLRAAAAASQALN